MQPIQVRVISLLVGIATAGHLFSAPATADEVTSKGTVLRGKVTRLTATGVEMAPEYGDGGLTIKWKDVEDVKTEASFQLLYNDADAVYSPVNGFRDGKLQVRDGEIDVSEIHSGIRLSGDQPTFMDRMRSGWRYWDGNFDVALNVSQATVDTTGLMVAFSTTRTKAPTRFLMGASYRFSQQKNTKRVTNPTPPGGITKTSDTETLEDEWKGVLRGEYDLTPRIYLFTSVDGEYDGIESLSLRTIPKLGAGYEIWHEDVAEGKKNFLRAEAGGAWVYERFFGGHSEDYFSIAFGAMAEYHLPFGHIDWHLDYLPAVDAWGTDYLIRTQASLVIPVFDPISIKATVADDYDNTPSDNSSKNSLYLMLGFSLGW